MTYVSTPQTGALGKKSTRRFGPIVAAIAIVVAAGAAIAAGFAFSEPEATTTATQSIYTERLEALKYESPEAVEAARADQVHRGRAPAIEANRADQVHIGRAPAHEQATFEELVRQGRVPTTEPAQQQATFEELVRQGRIPTATPPATQPAETPSSPLPFPNTPGSPE